MQVYIYIESFILVSFHIDTNNKEKGHNFVEICLEDKGFDPI